MAEAWKQQEQRVAAVQKHTQSLRYMAEALQMGRETAHTVSMQSEQLARTETAVDDTQHAVDLSKRVLRGMTWSGWIKNALTSAPQPDKDSQQNKSEEIAMGFICPECKIIFSSPEQLASHYNSTHDNLGAGQISDAGLNSGQSQRAALFQQEAQSHSSQSTEQLQTREDLHDDFLRKLEPQLAELKDASLALGSALETQNRHLERMDYKIDRVQDDMKRVSIQAKKIAGKKMPVVYRMRCALQEKETRRFLRDVDGELLLSADVIVDGCAFRMYTLGDDTEIWGLQSEKSSLFVGVNRFGYLKVKGGDLKSYEQLTIDIRKPTTPIFCLSSFLGYGGWISRKEDDSLSIIRGIPENKGAAAQFKLVNLDAIDPMH